MSGSEPYAINVKPFEYKPTYLPEDKKLLLFHFRTEI